MSEEQEDDRRERKKQKHVRECFYCDQMPVRTSRGQFMIFYPQHSTRGRNINIHINFTSLASIQLSSTTSFIIQQLAMAPKNGRGGEWLHNELRRFRFLRENRLRLVRPLSPLHELYPGHHRFYQAVYGRRDLELWIQAQRRRRQEERRVEMTTRRALWRAWRDAQLIRGE